MNTFARAARVMNSVMRPLLDAPIVGPKLRTSMTEITYVGRRSGRTITLPVAFRRRGDNEVIVGVAAASKKTWWRNFQPGPEPVSIVLDGVTRTGTGVAKVTDKGTTVVITLDS